MNSVDTPPSFLAEHWESRAVKAERESAALRRILWRAKVLLWRMQEQDATRVEHHEAHAKLRQEIDAYEKQWAPEERGRMEKTLAWAFSED